MLFKVADFLICILVTYWCCTNNLWIWIYICVFLGIRCGLYMLIYLSINMNLLLFLLFLMFPLCCDGRLSRMWEVMFECHKLQFQTMSTVYNNSHAGIAATHSELRRQITSYLESELHYLSSSFTKWIGAQKFYLEAINGWLHKCVSLKQKPGKKKRPQHPGRVIRQAFPTRFHRWHILEDHTFLGVDVGVSFSCLAFV